MAPGVSVAGIIDVGDLLEQRELLGQETTGDDLAFGRRLREKRVSAAAPPTRNTAPSSSARRFRFLRC